MESSLLERWKMGDPAVLNLAEFCPQTTALGPGNRAVVWVQGCALRCPGCISPSYRPFKPANLTTVKELASRILSNENTSGLTLSGGEIFHQAQGIANLIAILHRQRPNLTILAYSGYTLAQLKSSSRPGVAALLSRIDTLIDGPYVQELNNGNTGLLGSSNQIVHHFTPRLRNFDFEGSPRQPEVCIRSNELVFIGVPSSKFSNALNLALKTIGSINQRLAQDVRA